MGLQRPQVAFFDWDNTLISSWERIHECLAHTLRVFEMEPVSLAQVMATMHHSSREFFPRTFGDLAEDASKEFYKYYETIIHNPIITLDGAEQTLIEFQKNGITLGIISNKTGKYLRSEIETLGWNKYFAVIIGAKDLERDKPSAITVEHALSKIGGQIGAHNWFIGDTIVDVECAVNTGCTPIFFGEPHPESPLPESKGFKYTAARTHFDLQKLLAISLESQHNS